MLVFLSIVTIFYSVLGQDKNTRLKSLSILVIVLMIFTIGLRFDNLDYTNYRSVYNGINLGSNFGLFRTEVQGHNNYNIENGFAILVIFEKFFTGNFTFLLLLIASISIFIKYFAYKKLSPNLPLTILLYFSSYFFKDYVQIRNGLASSFILLSLIFINRKNAIAFYLTCIIAIQNHIQTICALPLLKLHNLLFKRKNLIYITTISLIVYIISGGIGKHLFTSINIPIFADNSAYLKEERITSIFNLQFIINIIISTLIIYYQKLLILKFKYSPQIITCYIFGFSITLLFSDIPIIFGRISETLCMPTQCILLAMIPELFKGKIRKLSIGIIILFALFKIIFNHSNEILNYKCILFY